MARQVKNKGSAKTSATVVQHWQTRFKANLAKRFFLRLHMSLILFTTGLGGFLVNRIMLWVGVHSMPVRYGAAALLAYGVFLLCIRLWLRYVGGTPSRRLTPVGQPSDVYVGDIGQGVVDGLHGAGRSLGSWSPGSSGGPVAPSGDAAAGTFFGSGSPSGSVGDAAEGTFLGGGSSSSGIGEAAGGSFWSVGDGDAPAPGDAEINAAAAAFFDHSAVADATSSSASLGDLSLPSGGGGGGGFDLDLGDDAGAVVAIIALVVIVVAVCGAGVYLVWQAPMILSDAAFQVVMTWAVRRKAGEVDDAAWVGSVVKATVWPFVAILVLTVVTGAVVQGMYPGVHSLGQLLNG